MGIDSALGISVPRPATPPRPRAGSRAGRLAAGWSAWLLPSVADLVFLLCLSVALAWGSTMLSADGDPGRHLAVGERILASGAIPRQDLFSHTMAGQPFVPYEWLAEAASAASYRVAGLAGPVLLHAAIIGLAFAAAYRHLRRRGHAVLLALAVTLLAAAAAALHWLARPHVFTFLGTAVFAAILDGRHAGRLSARWLWALPAAMALWANLHGGFLIGFLLLGAYAAADALRWLAAPPGCPPPERQEARGKRHGAPQPPASSPAGSEARRRLAELALPAAATLAATLLNPAGPALLAHVTGYFGKHLLVDRTVEYLSPDFHQGATLPFLAMLLGTVAAVAWSRRRPALHEGLLLLGFTACALYSQRNVPLFAIAVAPLLAAQLEALAPAAGERRPGRALGRIQAWLARRNRRTTQMDDRLRGHLWPALAVAGLLLLAAAQRRAGVAPLDVEFDPQRQPVAAAAYLRARPPAGNGFNEVGWGGYLLHTLWPAQRVFIDGQTDFYGEPLAREYLRVAQLESGWEAVLDRYGVRWVIFPTDSPLVRRLASTPPWEVAYQDRLATVLIQGQGAPGGR